MMVILGWAQIYSSFGAIELSRGDPTVFVQTPNKLGQVDRLLAIALSSHRVTHRQVVARATTASGFKVELLKTAPWSLNDTREIVRFDNVICLQMLVFGQFRATQL